MKKTLLTWSLIVVSVSTFAQGTITVGNGITATRFPIYGANPNNLVEQLTGNSALSSPTGTTVYGGALLSGTRYKIEFWAGPASAADFSGLTLITTMTFRTGSNPSLLPNGITPTINNVVVPGVLPGQQARLAVRVWDSTYNQLTGLEFFESVSRRGSALFLSAGLGGADSGGNLYTSPNWVGQSFNIAYTPEPSSFAILSIGAISAFLFRQRR